jgi:hypothetical protein
VTTTIPIFSIDQHFVRMVQDHEARAMLAANTHTLVRDRAGNTRRLYERPVEDAPLRGAAKRQACASYIGAVKYTYIEQLMVPSHLHMLKRLTPSGEFKRW